MKVRTVRSVDCFRRHRLDGSYYNAEGVAARDRVTALRANGIETTTIGALARVWQPPRFKRMYAGDGEAAVGYLRPYDVLEYLPQAPERLSRYRTEGLGRYFVEEGWLLQTCSGRNLGPCAYVDSHVAEHAVSHDILRIQVDEEALQYYVLAFVLTSTGQAIVRSSRSGSVVDHVTPRDVGDIELPLLPTSVRSRIADTMKEALGHIAWAREQLKSLLAFLGRQYPAGEDGFRARDGWTARPSGLIGRLDAAFYDPRVRRSRQQLRDAGGVECGNFGRALLPNRYRRYYVRPEYGRPILSGRQLLQLDPVNLRYISDRSFEDAEGMVLQAGMVAFGAVGRWEGRLGLPGLITPEREGWLASNDVMRIAPYEGGCGGWLWLAMAMSQVQEQISALPYGSVIDHLGPRDVENRVVLPPVDLELGRLASEAWHCFDWGRRLKREAVEIMEEWMDEGVGESPGTGAAGLGDARP